MRILSLSLRRGRLTALTSTAGALLLAAAACGVDDERTMHTTSRAGSGGASAGTTAMPVSDSGSAGQAGERETPGGSAGKAGSGGSAGSASAAGLGGKGGSGAASLCGNGKPDPGEECDDDNVDSGDGCSATCQSACETCEEALKDDELAPALIGGDNYFDCYRSTDRASGGPADGAPRAALCAAVVDCVRRTGCAVFAGDWIEGYNVSGDAALAPCWCSDLQDAQGLPQAAPSCYSEATLNPGPCYADFQNGAEADSPVGIGTAIIDSGLALGRAGRLLRQSDSLFCARDCWPDPAAQGGAGGGGGMSGSGGVPGNSGNGGMNGGHAGTGGSAAGSAGSGGSAGGSALCGNGKLDENEQCEPPATATCSDDCQRVADDACVNSPCEADSACVDLAENCLLFDGVARTLCYDVMECVRNSNCADGPTTGAGLTQCFCGDLTTAKCISAPSSGPGAPAGACASLIRQGFSSGSPATNSEVLNNFQDDGFPAGAAIHRMNCDWSQLSTDCRKWCGY
jgi:cysteine-rich repeat protein